MIQPPPVITARITARAIAARYDEDLAARWQCGATTNSSFGSWLESYWRTDAPPEPPIRPAAVSGLGWGSEDETIHWYETATSVLGYVPGYFDRCYQIPRDAALPVCSYPVDELALAGTDDAAH